MGWSDQTEGGREPWDCLERTVGGERWGAWAEPGVGREGAAAQAPQAALGFMPEE